MKQGWGIRPFEKCIEKVKYTTKIATCDYSTMGAYPVVSQEEEYISGYWNNAEDVFKVSKPVVIFGDHTRVLKYVDFDFVLGADGVKILQPIDAINAKFFLYYLIASKMPSLGYSRHYKLLKELNVPVPPIAEQEKIVAELDCLSGIIEKKKQQLKELDTLAHSIFYEMFGDPAINDRELNIKKLGDVVNSVNYGTSSPANDGGRFTYLRMNNLTYAGYLDLKDVKSIDVPDKDLEKCVVRKGDILFNRTNSKELVGKTALFDLNDEMVIAGYIIRVRVKAEEVLPIYVVRYMNTPFMKSYFSELCKGAVNQANINSKELKAIHIPVPSIHCQQEFASKIEAIEKQKELIKQSIQETETLFNSRMDYYFN